MKADAERWLDTELRQREDGGADPRMRKATVGEVLDRWLVSRIEARANDPEHRRGVAANTAGEYRRIIDQRLVPCRVRKDRKRIGDLPVRELYADDVRELLRWLRLPEANLRGRKLGNFLANPAGELHDPEHCDSPPCTHQAASGLGPTAVQHTFTLLSSALRWALREGYVAVNVCDKVDRPGRARPKPKVWQPAELAAFLEVADQDRLAALWRLAIASGARRAELLGVKWSSVDLQAATVRIERRLLRATEPDPDTGKGRVVMVEAPATKTGEGGERTIAIDAATVAALKAWQQGQRRERMRWGAARKGTVPPSAGWVFTREDGLPTSADYVQGRFARLARDADVPRIRFHDLRHTTASILLDRGVPEATIKQRLGWSPNSPMLRTVYGHAMEGRDAEAADIMAAAMGGQ